MRRIFLTPLFILFFLLTSCDFGPNSGRGFSLPEGNIEKGRTTFIELECNACHSIGDIKRVAGRDCGMFKCNSAQDGIASERQHSHGCQCENPCYRHIAP